MEDTVSEEYAPGLVGNIIGFNSINTNLISQILFLVLGIASLSSLCGPYFSSDKTEGNFF